MCLGIAVLLTAIDGTHFGAKFTYSMAIGGCCVGVVECLRLATAALDDALRRRRGEPPRAARPSRSWRGYVPTVVASLLIGPALGSWIGDRLTGYHTPSLLSLAESNTRMTLALTLLGAALSHYVFANMERLAVARAEAEAARRLAAENQLRLLQSQLEPHMLFNTLANLRVLIALDPARAQAMLDHLIAFLRATLSASRSDAQTLAAEFAQLGDYLALMAVRMGPRLAVELDLPPALAAHPVPPLLLQPLVENAIKHGLEPAVEGGRIRVAARRVGDRLLLTVADTGVGLASAAAGAAATAGANGSAQGGGFGLEQVRSRLAALHGADARLTLAAAAGGGAQATIDLPWGGEA
ncbi:MAG: histidine kinase [Burkholderiales bacterium]|nr:histidine kinase [Burkholderiales bacterium]